MLLHISVIKDFYFILYKRAENKYDVKIYSRNYITRSSFLMFFKPGNLLLNVLVYM